MIKKVTIYLFVVLFSVLVFSFVVPANVSANCIVGYDGNFLHFPTWDRGLTGEEVPDGAGGMQCVLNIRQGSEPAATVFTIALNVIDIALRVVSLIAVGFIIFGGFQYITAQGDSNKVTSGKQTIVRALIGMVIAILASAIVTFLVRTLGS